MTIDAVQIVSIVTSALLLLLVIELVRRRLLTEEYSLVWIAGAAALLLLSLWRNVLHVAARWLGIYYPPALLLLALVLLTFVVALSFSVALSRHRQQIEKLTEEVALLEAELRELRRAGEPDAYDSARRP